jgi:DNA mismatch repair protein MutS
VKRNFFRFHNRCYVGSYILSLALVLNIIGGVGVQVAAEQQNNATYANISKFHLPALSEEEIKENKKFSEIRRQNEEIEKQSEKQVRFWQRKKDHLSKVTIPSVGNIEQLRMLFDLFDRKKKGDSKEEEEDTPKNVYPLSNGVQNDLEILCGGKGYLNHYLFKNLDYTQTKLGRIQLQKILSEPTTDINELKRRQNIVKALVSDEELFNSLDEKLQKIKGIEAEMLWFWKDLDQASQKFFDQAYFKNFLFKNFNNNEEVLEAGALWTTVGSPSLSILSPFVTLYIISLGLKFFHNSVVGEGDRKEMADFFKSDTHFVNSYVELLKRIGTSFGRYLKILFKGSISKKDFYGEGDDTEKLPISLYSRVISLIPLAFWGFLYYRGVSGSVGNALTFEKVSKDIQKRMIPLGTFSEETRALALMAKENETLFNELKSVITIAKSYSANYSDPTTSMLLKSLLSGSFKGEPRFLCNKGNVLNVFKQIFQVKDNLINSMKAVGEIDAYLSIAKLYKKFKNHQNVTYSFVDYVDNAKTPCININDFWHPILNPKTVVVNDIELGNKEKPNNVVITGPNAGGKSTVLKSVAIAIVLAQTFGIAPAKSMVMTPFTLISTYLNIADTEGRESLFQAEMRRAQELLHDIKALRPREFSFVIMDEIFTGTNPKEGMAGAYGIAKKLSTYKNAVSVIATHFMVLTDLAQDTNDLFKNQKVSIIREDGRITYPYKLEPGITDQAIALDLLEQEGFDSEILEAAQGILDRDHLGRKTGLDRPVEKNKLMEKTNP